MKIRILGSGGGENYPAPFCSCAHCEEARKVGGKSLRSLSQTIINDDLLIDFPADTDSHCTKYGVNLGALQNILITHSHHDHYMPISAVCRGGNGAHKLKYEKLRFYGPNDLKKVFDTVISAYGTNPNINNIEFYTFENQKPQTIGEYTITPLTALHAPKLGSLNYIIEDGQKSILYLIDSGYPTDETLEYLESRNSAFDCVVMDGTMGVAPIKSYIYHMGFEENKILKDELINRKLANKNTRFVVTHITHNKAETHEKIEEIFSGTGIQVAYDGFEIEI